MQKYSWLSQFHYGSIKTPIKNPDYYWVFESQFHYGSIKTALVLMN